MIVETEAYLGLDDLAAHASRGRTERTRILFGPAGRAYVYFIYGMHECLNVVADREGEPGCVLIRALAPVSGITEMFERRHWTGPVTGLANGPGKLTQALAITRQQYGARLDRGESYHTRLAEKAAIRYWRHSTNWDYEVRGLAAALRLAGAPVFEPARGMKLRAARPVEWRKCMLEF